MIDLAQAARAFNEGRFSDAEHLCRQALATSPDNAQASWLLSQALVRLARLEEAEQVALLALDHNPAQADLLTLRAEVLARMGRNEEAIGSVTEAIDSRLINPRAHTLLSRLLAARGDPSPRFRVAVVTPSTGSALLAKAIESVQAQTYPLLEHLVVADGAEFHSAVTKLLPDSPRHPVHCLTLPLNTGATGYCGHRIYAAAPYLVNSLYVAFLDEDNWFEPDHVSSLMATISSRGFAWAYALRKIVDAEGQFIANDDCESLGQWPTWNDPNNHLVDVSCYMVRRDLAVAVSPLWYRRFRDEENPDFVICRQLLKDHPQCGTNGRYTVNYRVGSSSASVSAEFFLTGNAHMAQRFKQPFPWREVVSSAN